MQFLFSGLPAVKFWRVWQKTSAVKKLKSVYEGFFQTDTIVENCTNSLLFSTRNCNVCYTLFSIWLKNFWWCVNISHRKLFSTGTNRHNHNKLLWKDAEYIAKKWWIYCNTTTIWCSSQFYFILMTTIEFRVQ